MNFQIRKQKILELLAEVEHLEVKDIAAALPISEITVRRDLAILANQGLLVRTHGGAMKVGVSSNPAISFLQKSLVHFQEKEAICQLAASLIKDGDVVFLDCGSTVFRICTYIRHKPIKIVTNSLPIVNELIQAPSIRLNFAGGEIDMERQAAHGKMALGHFKNYCADIAFVGVDGISAKHGLSAASEKEAEITTILVENAKSAYLLCDSSKLEKDSYLPFAPIQFIPNLITDSLANPDILSAYESVGVKITVAS